MLTTPTCRCPGGDSEVSTDRDKMAVSPSVSQEPDRDKDKGLVVPGQPCFMAWAHSHPILPPPYHSYNAGTIIISPGSMSTDRSATSSSSSDKGPWLADRPQNSFQLRGAGEFRERATAEEITSRMHR